MAAIQSYGDFKASLEERGLKTTRTGQREANFADYGNALGGNVKQMVMDSFDNEQDYKLQSQLAAAFKNKNAVDMADIKSFCKANGIKCNVEYVKTQYIVDNKKGGKYANNTNAINGNIAVYTFSDGQGGEIKIADANGNGALESEELFMNEILSGITSDIAAANGMNSASSGQNSAQSIEKNKSSENLFDKKDELKEKKEAEKTEEKENLKEEDNRIVVSQAKFEDLVKDIMKSKGFTQATAINYILNTYCVNGKEDDDLMNMSLEIAA